MRRERKGRGETKGTDPLQALEPIFEQLQPVYQDRASGNLDCAWRLPERECPISLTNEEGQFLHAAIRANGLKSGYEVATGFGMSSFWAGLAFRETGGRLVSLDCYVEERKNDWNYAPEEAKASASLRDRPRGLAFAEAGAAQLGLSEVVSYKIGFSPEAVGRVLAGRTVDFVFLDGLHYRGQPLRDWEALLPFLASRCLVAFHDNLPYCDVPEAVRSAEAALGANAVVYPTRHHLTLVCRDVVLPPEPIRSQALIVVATNNGSKVLPPLLESLEQHGRGGCDLLLVDTGTTEAASLELLEALRGQGVAVTKTPYRGYDTGAYLWAYREREAETYLFLHDSLMATQPGWTAHFLTGDPVVALAAFPMAFDDEAQLDWLLTRFPADQMRPVSQGIFGPIFAARREALLTLERRGFLNAIPSNKNEQQAMERGWAIAFASCGIPVKYLVDFYQNVNSANVGLHKRLMQRA